MRKIQFLHLILNEKFTKPFVDFVNKNFKQDEHLFVIIGNNGYFNPEGGNVIWIKSKNLKNLYLVTTSMLISNHIFLHGLFSKYIVYLLSVQPPIARKSSWVLWGGDLYGYFLKETPSLREQILQKLKTFVVKNIHSIIALVEEDYKYAVRKFSTKAGYLYAFYPNPVKFEMLDSAMNVYRCSEITNNKKRILVGNSADPSNDHFKVLERLSRFDSNEFEIICPLSYGDQHYAKKVVEFGKERFGKRFVPLFKFLNPDEYASLLANVDIAIFAHRRQQALGNILALLYLGKKVYIRSDISTWLFFERLGLKVYDTLEILNGSDSDIFTFDKEVGLKSREIVYKEFSEERCVELWRQVFDSVR